MLHNLCDEMRERSGDLPAAAVEEVVLQNIECLGRYD